MRAFQRKTFEIKIILKELFLKMFILLQFDVVAKIFDSNPWNFYIKNRSSSAFWIFFQNFFCIFRSRMASFSYIYFGMKHHVSMKLKIDDNSSNIQNRIHSSNIKKGNRSSNRHIWLNAKKGVTHSEQKNLKFAISDFWLWWQSRTIF